jgi:hypothetical protein
MHAIKHVIAYLSTKLLINRRDLMLQLVIFLLTHRYDRMAIETCMAHWDAVLQGKISMAHLNY